MTEKTTFLSRRKEGLARSLGLAATLLSLPLLSFSHGAMGDFTLPQTLLNDVPIKVPEVEGQPVRRKVDPSEPCYDFPGLTVSRIHRDVPIYVEEEDPTRGEFILFYWKTEVNEEGQKRIDSSGGHEMTVRIEMRKDPEHSFLVPKFMDEQGRAFELPDMTFPNDGSVDQSNCGRPMWYLFGKDGAPNAERPIYLNAGGIPYLFGPGKLPGNEDTGNRRYNQPKLEEAAVGTLFGPVPESPDGTVYLISPGETIFSLSGWDGYRFLSPECIRRLEGTRPAGPNFPLDMQPGDTPVYVDKSYQFVLMKEPRSCPMGRCKSELGPGQVIHGTVWGYIRSYPEQGPDFCS